MNHLAFVPDLFTHVPGPGRADQDLDRVQFVVHDLEPGAYVFFKIKIRRCFEAFIGYVQHGDAIDDKGPDLFAQVAQADDVDRAFVKPDLVRLDFTNFGSRGSQRLITDLDAAVFQGGLVDLGHDTAEALVILVGPNARVKGRLNTVQVFDGFRDQVGVDFLNQ